MLSRVVRMALWVPLLLLAQTALTPNQIQCPVGSQPQVLATIGTTGANGTTTGARLLCAILQGATISNTNPPVITFNGSGTQVDGEVPGGNIDGTNVNFTLSAIPSPPSSLHLKYNGMEIYAIGPPGAAADYSLSGNNITMVAIVPQPGTRLSADYRH